MALRTQDATSRSCQEIQQADVENRAGIHVLVEDSGAAVGMVAGESSMVRVIRYIGHAAERW
jgi:hypothetical protein